MPEGPEEVLDRVSRWPENIALLIAGRRPDNHHRKDKLIRLYRITGAAAAIALLVLAGWILFKGPRHGQTSPDLVSRPGSLDRSEEHTSELQSLMRNSYAVFCLKKKTKQRLKS